MEIIPVDSSILGASPAGCDRTAGIVYVNADVIGNYSEFEQDFWIEHEIGHCVLQTGDEFEADSYALCRLFGKYEKSLKKSLITLYNLGVPEERINALFEKILELDNLYKMENERLPMNFDSACYDEGVVTGKKFISFNAIALYLIAIAIFWLARTYAKR
jgi:hypothetical protein